MARLPGIVKHPAPPGLRPAPARGRCDPRTAQGTGTAGFTLVELMIVVAVLSLLTLSVTLGVNRPRVPGSQDWARFQRLHDRLREQAVMGQRTLGVQFRDTGYQRQVRTAAGWQDEGPAGSWTRPVRIERPFGATDRVTFLPNGQSTPVRVAFAGADATQAETVCSTDGWDPVACTAR